MERTTFIPINTYRNLKCCVPKKKITIYPDGNCLYRALSWWVTERKDYHEYIRAKIVEFMRESLACQKKVKNKSNKNIEEYIRQNNIMSSTVWGTDVEIFSAAIWLETDIFILIDDTCNIFSHKGFHPKKGRNIPSKLGIYIENSCLHYEPIASVIRKGYSKEKL